MSDDRSSNIVSTGAEGADRGAAPAPTPDGTPIPDTASSGTSPEDDSSQLPSETGNAQQIDSQKTVISKRPPVSPPAFRRAANPFEMGEALEGEQLGHFQLEEFVGGGGMGAVFRATDTMLGRTVAVKVVSREQTSEDTLRRFKNEAQSAARLDHPNIARVYYVGEDKGWNYIVLEYIEGVNVRDLVEHNGPLSLEDAVSYTLQIAEALEHASQRDVTHRDIKPSNILIMVDGRAKLVDMGLARLQQVESSTDDLTASGVTLGTFDYISPEQARDPRNTDVRSDLYSLGCTLFFMLTGRPPFPEGTVLQKLLSHSSDEPPDLREYRPDIDEQVAEIINKLLAKQPEQRYQTPRELIGVLLLLADRLELSGIQATSSVWFAPSDHKPAWWVEHVPWIAACVTLLLIAVIYHWVNSSVEPALPPPPLIAANGDSSVSAPKSSSESTPPSSDRTTTPDDGSSQETTSNESVASEKGASSSDSTVDSGDAASTGRLDGKNARVPRDALDEPNEPPPDTETKPATAPQEPLPTTSQSKTPAGDAQSASNLPTPNGNPATAQVPFTSEKGRTKLLVVTNEPLTANETADTVGSLEEAIDEAAQSEVPVEIELRTDGLHWIQPLSIDTDRFAENRLSIRAAQGTRPVVAFRAATEFADNTSSMINIIGGRVSWQGIDFYMELPTDVQRGQGQSLLRLDTTSITEFRECTFTIRNVDPQGNAVARNIAFIDVVGPGEFGGLLFDSRPLAGNAPTIWLENCVARGQAILVRAEFAVPFSFSWEHGLFVSTERLVEVGGTVFEPRWEHGGVNIFLKRLLAVADKGICLIHSDHLAPYSLGVSVTCDDCLFATQVTTPPTPLYVVRTGSAVTSRDLPLETHGNRNYYKNTQIVLRVEVNGDRNAIEEYSFDDLTGPTSPSWFNEKAPEPAAVFSWDAPTESVDRQSLHDFIPPGIGDGWFTRALTLVPDQLPRLPDIPRMTSTENSNDHSTRPTPDHNLPEQESSSPTHEPDPFETPAG